MIIDREFISHAIIGQNVLTVEHNAHYVGGSSVRYDEAASPHHEPVIFRANCSIQPSSLEYRGFNPVVQFSGYQEINWYECLIFEIRGTLDLGNWSHLLEAISLYVDAILPLGLLAKCEKQRNRDKKSILNAPKMGRCRRWFWPPASPPEWTFWSTTCHGSRKSHCNVVWRLLSYGLLFMSLYNSVFDMLGCAT